MIDIERATSKLKSLNLSLSQIDTIIYFILCAKTNNHTIHNWYINEEKEISIVYTGNEEQNEKIKYVYSVLDSGSYCQRWSADRNYAYFEKTYQRIQSSKEIEI